MTEIHKVRILDGKKFVWDDEEYESEERASAIEKNYREQGFEVQRLSVGGKVFLYTRRPVSSTENC